MGEYWPELAVNFRCSIVSKRKTCSLIERKNVEQKCVEDWEVKKWEIKKWVFRANVYKPIFKKKGPNKKKEQFVIKWQLETKKQNHRPTKKVSFENFIVPLTCISEG